MYAIRSYYAISIDDLSGDSDKKETKDDVAKREIKSDVELKVVGKIDLEKPNRITSYNVCYTKLLRLNNFINQQKWGTMR